MEDYVLRVLALVAITALWLATGSVAAAPATSTLATKATHAAKAAPKVKLPATVRAAFETAYPKATIKNVSTEREDGEIHYEVESIDGTMARDLIYRADGTVVEMEEGLSEADLPPPVRDAVAAKYPKSKILKAERLTRGTTVSYELQVKTGKKTQEVTLDPAGAPVKTKKEASEKESER
jgi:uncharacterized membrane protein YkoI